MTDHPGLEALPGSPATLESIKPGRRKEPTAETCLKMSASARRRWMPAVAKGRGVLDSDFDELEA